MNQRTVESLFGANAGIVWKTLNENGPSNLARLMKSTSLSREEVFGALGWLGREDKILVEQKGRAMVFSLRDEEARLTIPEDTTTEEPTPRSKSKRRKTKPPKKSKKARSVKALVKQTESTAEQSERVEEFLLH
jgi:Winged helix-turn-helix domain (DUF2582)